MLEGSQALIRIVALACTTIAFAAGWSNDQVPALAGEPAAQPNPFVQFFNELNGQPAHESHARVVVEINGICKSFELETTSPHLQGEALREHLAQIPLGIAEGDYQIVDQDGQSGWLRVRTNMPLTSNQNATLLTTVKNQTVRYSKATPTMIGSVDQTVVR